MRLLEEILNNSIEMIQVSDAETLTMLYANEPARKYTGHSDQPYQGKHCYEYMMGFTEQCPFCPLKRLGEGECFETEVDNGQEVFAVKTRKTVWEGREVFVEYAWNITDRHRKSEEALRNALAAAEHANKAKTIFLSNMSHDIRTPMNAIIGYTALAATHIDDKELVQDYLNKINISSTHLLSLINDVLDMSRIESGSVKIEETEVHIPDILHDLRTIIQGNISAKQLDLYIDTQDVMHEDIITDKLRLNQVLLNIISNAVKFTPVGGMINVRVSEKPCSMNGYTTFEFSIKDNGIGMSKEFQEHVFDSFSRERTTTKTGISGTGLGMAITKNVIDMMGGTISLKSEEGKGTEFIITIPCKLSDKKITYGPIPELQGARALVVDDDINTCMSVSKMLRSIEMRADWTARMRWSA